VGWIPASGEGASGLSDQRIRAAIESAMEAKGHRLVDLESADLGVGYFVTSEDQTSYQTVTTGFSSGYNRGYRSRGRGWSGGGGVSTSTTTERNYTVGTLVLAVFDRQSQDLIWEATAEGTRQDSGSPEAQAKIEENITKVLADFPPS